MKCSGSPKCKCTKFWGAPKAKRCEGCRHSHNSHYKPDSDENDDGSSDEEVSNGAGGDDDSSDDNTALPSTGMTNTMIVSSLFADLRGSGESPKVDLDTASREAKAGLTRQQVSSAFAGSYPQNAS